jgi:hypothetical protein
MRSAIRNLASRGCGMHRLPMRRFTPVLTLLVAACVAPRQPVAPTPTPVVAAPQQVRTGLIGLTAAELVAHFGSPALQVREGSSLKLQFRSRRCVLDAYLYPPPGASAPLRVAHVDARLPSGLDTDQAACVSALENPSI